ncbi:MAG: HNH endonuclease signature motif containing protein, partial [Candidatus Syntrophosphaera sp.]
VKRTFSRSKRAKEFKDKHIVKGIKGKRGGKMVRCQDCGDVVPYYKAQIDHIEPICPTMISQKVMSFVMLYERTFCDDDNLQVICPTCHKKKNDKEKKERVKWRKKKKYLVCRHVQGSRMKVIGITNL